MPSASDSSLPTAGYFPTLYELLLTEFDTRLYIDALGACLHYPGSMSPENTNALLSLRAQLRRGLSRPV